jgi:hypothetical protein
VNERAQDTWSWREAPLLRIALRETDAGRFPDFEQLTAETGIDKHQVWLGMRAHFSRFGSRLTPRARCSAHPPKSMA